MNKATIVIDSSKNNCIGTSTNFEYILSKPIKCKKLKLLFAAIPYSWYLINEKNSHFKISFADTSIHNAYLPWGNYDVNSLAITIKNLINYANFNMSFDNWLMKYIFSADQNFIVYNDKTTINNILGCYDQQQSNWNIMMSNDLVNFLWDTLFYIKINSFSNNIIQDNAFLYTFIIPNTVWKNEICFYKNTTNENELYFYEQYIDKLQISIYDTDNV